VSGLREQSGTRRRIPPRLIRAIPRIRRKIHPRENRPKNRCRRSLPGTVNDRVLEVGWEVVVPALVGAWEEDLAGVGRSGAVEARLEEGEDRLEEAQGPGALRVVRGAAREWLARE
jgi:hypothetical protein